MKGNVIKGGFCTEELQKIKHPDIFIIKKFIRKGNEVYVKWLGLNNGHNSWISKDQIVQLTL